MYSSHTWLWLDIINLSSRYVIDDMSLEPPNPAHVYEFRNPVAKWHYKHIEIRNKVGNLEGRILKNDALVRSKTLL